VVRVEACCPRMRRFKSPLEHLLTIAFECGGEGWQAGTREESQARRIGAKFSDVGGGGGGSGRDTLEFLHLHYAQETTSLSTILCITRRIFFSVSGE
jgi:hypothetical protein